MGFYDINQMNLNFIMERQKILVDTNVLYWIFYEKGIYVKSTKKTIYQNFFSNSVKKNDYIVTTLTLNELFTIIEKNEYELYCDAEGKDKEEFSLKKFRKETERRENVRNICYLIYKQIQESMEIRSCCLNKEMIESFLDDYNEKIMDCSDYAIIEFCKNNQINGILTDDADFKYIKEDMTVYSANPKMAN